MQIDFLLAANHELWLKSFCCSKPKQLLLCMWHSRKRTCDCLSLSLSFFKSQTFFWQFSISLWFVSMAALALCVVSSLSVKCMLKHFWSSVDNIDLIMSHWNISSECVRVCAWTWHTLYLALTQGITNGSDHTHINTQTRTLNALSTKYEH